MDTKLKEEVYYGGTSETSSGVSTPATTNLDISGGTTDATVHVPHVTTGGDSYGNVLVKDGSKTAPDQIFVTDNTITAGNNWYTEASLSAANDLTIGNIKIVVKDNGEIMVCLDDVEYHFSKKKVKSFLEKFADVKVE